MWNVATTTVSFPEIGYWVGIGLWSSKSVDAARVRFTLNTSVHRFATLFITRPRSTDDDAEKQPYGGRFDS